MRDGVSAFGKKLTKGFAMAMHKEYLGKIALVRWKGGALGEEIVDDCSTGAPEYIALGAGQIPRGIEEAIYDMEIGEQRDVVVPAEKAYGEHDPEGVVKYLRSFLADGFDLHVGDFVAWEHPVSHQMVPVRVVEENDYEVVIDFNHPLAGKELAYWLELVDVIEG